MSIWCDSAGFSSGSMDGYDMVNYLVDKCYVEKEEAEKLLQVVELKVDTTEQA